MISMLPILSYSKKESIFNSYFVLPNCNYLVQDCLFFPKLIFLQFLLFLHSITTMPLPYVPSDFSMPTPFYSPLKSNFASHLSSKIATEHSRAVHSNHLAENSWGYLQQNMKRVKIFQTTILVSKILLFLFLLNTTIFLGYVPKEQKIGT